MNASCDTCYCISDLYTMHLPASKKLKKKKKIKKKDKFGTHVFNSVSRKFITVGSLDTLLLFRNAVFDDSLPAEEYYQQKFLNLNCIFFIMLKTEKFQQGVADPCKQNPIPIWFQPVSIKPPWWKERGPLFWTHYNLNIKYLWINTMDVMSPTNKSMKNHLANSTFDNIILYLLCFTVCCKSIRLFYQSLSLQ